MKIYHKNGASPVLGELFQESTNQKQQILMSVIGSKLHLLQVEHNVAPSDADIAPQFGLGKAPVILYPINVAAVTAGEHLRVQNQAVAITVSEQPGIAPESIRINRAATRDLLPDNLICRGTTRITLGTGRAYTRPPPLQKPKQYEFALPSSAPQMVADSPKAAFINLDFAV